MWRDDEDHIFHDVTDITLTDQDPTDPRSILDLIAEMEKVVWDLTWLPSFHAQMVANLKEHLHTQQMSGPDN